MLQLRPVPAFDEGALIRRSHGNAGGRREAGNSEQLADLRPSWVWRRLHGPGGAVPQLGKRHVHAGAVRVVLDGVQLDADKQETALS